MKKLLLQLQGYTQIDETSAEWEIIQYNLEGELISVVDYSNYYVFYNAKKDKYALTVGGFRPFASILYIEMMSMLNFLNSKPKNSKTTFWKNSQDYFIQKTNLEKVIQDSFNLEATETVQIENSSEMLDRIRVVRAELTHHKENLGTMKSEDPKLIKTMQDFKKNVLQKNPAIDIWQDLGNVVITSEGCYFTTYQKYLDFNGGTSEE